MVGEYLRAGDASQLIQQLGELLEWPVVAVVVATAPHEYAFVFDGEVTLAYVLMTLSAVRDAAQDALKSL